MKQKKCKHCKDLFTPRRTTLEKYCMDKPECVEIMVNEAKLKQWKQKKAKLKSESMTLSDYIQIAQTIFNKYIRLRDHGKMCISCGKEINGVRHASHYLSAGGHFNVRFNEDNVWVSCYKCNVMLSGNQIEYRKRLINQIGIERVEYLESIASETKKFTIEDLKELIEHYKQKIKQLENEI